MREYKHIHVTKDEQEHPSKITIASDIFTMLKALEKSSLKTSKNLSCNTTVKSLR